MSYSNSQEQTIYRSLAGQIQLGFFDGGEHFPSAQEIARQYQVSYCPAQRALKILEQKDLVRLCRGKETAVLGKPYEDYLNSKVFQNRLDALVDLTKSLAVFSADIGFQGMCHMQEADLPLKKPDGNGRPHQGKIFYHLFGQSLKALGSRTVLSLYYDIDAFLESAYLDLLHLYLGKDAANLYLQNQINAMYLSFQDCQNRRYADALHRHKTLEKQFFDEMERCFNKIQINPACESSSAFSWEPHKGRTRYRDVIAIDLICKIHQGVYPVGSLLPNPILADVYHVSEITIRRTIGLLNQLHITRTTNGVGTRILSGGDATIPYQLKTLMLDDNLRDFLEAFQLLAFTCGPVVQYTFPYFSEGSLHALQQALDIREARASTVSVLSACIQAVARCCPLSAIREIYRKITFLLLKGNILRLGETGKEPVVSWSGLHTKLSEGLKNRDGTRFAQAFRQLLDHNFSEIKRNLLEIGVSGVEGVVTPVASSMNIKPN